MFNKDKILRKSTNIKSLKDLIAIENPDITIQNKKYSSLITQIQEALYLSEIAFGQNIIPIIRNTFRYCQNLPETSLYYSQPGGLVDLALNRADAALQLMRHILVLDKNSTPSEEQKLWLYALFSAAMLQGLGKLYTDYQVDVYDKNGYFVKVWQPLLEGADEVGSYYHYELLRGDDINFKNNITPLMARKIMPKFGFEQIMSNSEVFSVWLALLREDKDAAGPLAAILDRANAIAMQRYINSFLLQYSYVDGPKGRVGTFIDTSQESSIDKERILGAEFINWLTKSLEDGKFILNKDPRLIQVTEASVVLHPEVLDIYMQEHKKLKNRVALQKAFLAWNLHLLTDAAMAAKTFNKIPINTALLPEKVLVYNNKTDRINKIDSLDLVLNLQSYNQISPVDLKIKMSRLNELGKWVSGDTIVADLKKSSTHRT